LAKLRQRAAKAAALEIKPLRPESGDLDGAWESYILYLNSTPAEKDSKREQAERFLREQYNMRRTLSTGS